MTSPVRQPSAAPDLVRAEVARVLTASEFAASRHLTNFLQFVVEETLAGREDRLKERNIALGALGRDADFDPRLDCIVRVVAGKLRRALDRHYAICGAPCSLRIAVPAGSYVPEFRPAASRPPKDINRAPASTPEGARLRSDPAGRPLVLVAPLNCLTDGPDEHLVAEVLADDLAVQLSRRRWLEVLDYRLARSPGVDPEDPRTIAERLHADFVLTGTVSHIADRVRVTARLVDVGSGVLAWAEQYEERLPDASFSGSDDIVNRTVSRVGDLFGVLTAAVWSHAARKRNGEITPFEAALCGLQYQSRFDRESFPQTLRSVERAVMKSPDFAWGWAVLGSLHLDLACAIAPGGAPDDLQQALAQIQRALKIDPACGYAHFLLGLCHLFSQHPAEAIECAGRALEFSPGSPFETGAAGVLLSLAGEHARGESLISEACQQNPRLPGWIHWGSALGALGEGDTDGALAATSRFSLPDCFWDPLLRAAILEEAGEHAEAKAALELACRLQPELHRRPAEIIGMFVVEPHVRERIFGRLRDLGLRLDRVVAKAAASRANGHR
jgi:adenylate cyclase